MSVELLAERLAERTLALINIPSVSHGEQGILAHLQSSAGALNDFETQQAPGDGLLLAPRRTGKPLVVLAGHVDTVPAQDNLPGRRAGDVIYGLGASDMKSSLAVMLEMAAWQAAEQPVLAVDLAYLFFAREELPITESAVPALFQHCPSLREASLLVVMEPTDGTIQLGCLGNLNAEVEFNGKSAHSARPWQGDNALHKAILGLQAIATLEPQPVHIGGLTYTEVVSLTRIRAGIAANVIPDQVTAHVNYRYAPDRTPHDAEKHLRRWLPEECTLRVLGNAPPARVAIANPLVDRLQRAGDLSIEAKQAWTPVAEFSAEGLDAINFGPGASIHAHQRNEQVQIGDIVRAFQVLQRFALGGDHAD